MVKKIFNKRDTNTISQLVLVILILFLHSFALGQTINMSEESLVSRENQANELNLKWDEKSLKTAIEIYQENSEIWLGKKNYKKQVYCLTEIARINLKLRNKLNSQELFEKNLKNAEEYNLVEEQIILLSELSIIYFELGKTEKSKVSFEKALTKSEQVEDPITKSFAFFSAAEFYYFNVNLDKSQTYYEKAIENWNKSGYLIGEIKALLGLGYLFLRINEDEKGLVLFRKAFDSSQKASDIRGQAISLKAIGSALNNLNEKQKALEYYLKAEKMFPENIDLTEKGILNNGIGSIYKFYNEWNLAFEYKKKAIELFKRDNFVYGQLVTLSNLGSLSFSIGDEKSAFEYLKESTRLALLTKNQYHLALSYEELGNIYFGKEEFSQALIEFNKSLKIYSKIANQRQLSLVLNKIGQIYAKRKEYTISRNYFDQSLKLNIKVKNKFAEAETLFHLANLDRLDEDMTKALQLSEKSVEVTESLYSDVINSKLKTTYFSNVFDRYELYINLLMKKQKETPNAGFALRALQVAEKSRARSMLETLRMSEAKFNADADPELVRREREVLALLNTKADKLTEILSAKADETEVKKLDDEINTLKNDLEEIKANFKQNSPIYSQIKNPELFDVLKFQNEVLDENTLLLEFSIGKDTSYLWLIEKKDLIVFELPSQGIIEPKIRKLLELLTEREMREGEELENYQARLMAAESEYKQKAKELSNELLGKVGDKLANKRLLVVADGILNYFPLSALPAPNSDELLIAKNEIVYQPSASAISFLQMRQNKTASKDVMVFADAIFSQNDARVNAEKGNVELAYNTLKDVFRSTRQFDSVKSLPRLGASQNEAASISEIFGTSRSLIISGAEARRERALDADLADYRIVHFATHGLLNEEHPEFSSIVFSLYDEKGESLKGFLRLQDIYNLNLASDLIVLSACDSAIGKEIKGEGVISLTRGFMQAGSKSVLSSLWKVEDNATAELMKIFYSKLLNESLTPAEALRRAQLEMSQNPRYRSPFYWAAFTLQGEYRYEFTKPSFFKNYSIYIGLAIAAILGFGGSFAYRKFRPSY